MDDFLQESAASGQKLTAEESFTLAPEKVWARLQQTLPKTEFWILKLVQAAVGWEAESLDFEASDEEFVARFALPNPAPSFHEFWSSDRLQGPLHHLRVALATICREQEDGEVKLDWQTTESGLSFLWKGAVNRPEQSPIEACPRPELKLTITPTEGSWLGRLFRGDLFHKEWYCLKDRLYRDLICTSVNGEDLAQLEPNEVMFRPILAEARPEQAGLLSLTYRYHRSLVLPRYLDFMKSTRTKQRRGDYGSRLMPITATTIHWVLDGVVVDRWRQDSMDVAVAADIFLSAQDLELDLSGFAVLPTDLAQKRVDQSQDWQRKLLHQAKVDLSNKLEHRAHRAKVKKSVYGMDLFVGVLFPPYLLLGLVEAFRLPKVSTRLLEADLALCQEHIERRAGALSTPQFEESEASKAD